MLRGLATVTFFADDLAAAKEWYSELLGIDTYYQFPPQGPPAYVEFRVGDYQDELGFIDRRYAPRDAATKPAGAVIYWHVDDLTATFEKLLSMGAKEHEKPTERGAGTGFVTASVIEPFGNVLGIMSNPHYLEVLASVRPPAQS